MRRTTAPSRSHGCQHFLFAAGIAAWAATSSANPILQPSDARPLYDRELPRAAIFEGPMATPPRPWDGLIDRFRDPSPTPTGDADARWSDEFGLPAFDSRIQDLVTWKGQLVAGGWFSRAGSAHCPGIAAWNGRAWRPMGLLAGSQVSDLLVVGDTLYAAGRLFTAPGERGYVAWRTGDEWHVLGSSFSGSAFSLARLGGQPVVVGTFVAAVDSNYVAMRWSGEEWQPFGDPVRSFAVGLRSAVHQERLVVGGYFEAADSVAVAVIAGQGAEWDTVLSSVVHEGSSAPVVDDFAVIGSRLYVVGFLQGAHGASTALEWDGTEWTPIDPAPGSRVRRLAVESGGLIGGGYLRSSESALEEVSVARWNGSEWTTVGTLSGDVTALEARPDRIVAAGAFGEYRENPVPQRYVAQWNGSSWGSLDGQTRGFGVDGPLLPTVSSLTVIDDVLHVCGNYAWSHGGADWERLHSPARWTGNGWESATVHLYGQGAEGIVKWNGQLLGSQRYWGLGRIEPTGIEPISGAPYGVRTMTVYRGEVVLGGSFNELAGGPANGVARWNGSRWDAMEAVAAAPLDWYAGVNAFVEFQGRLIAAGTFEQIGGVAAVNVAAWDGSSWQPLGAGVPGGVYALQVHQDVLYAGGAIGLVRWSGAQWVGVPGTSMVRSLASDRGDLYAAGRFWDIEGGIARWDGHSWSGLGSGFATSAALALIETMLVHDGWLWIGGRFSSAGGKSAFSITRWRLGGMNPRPGLWPRIAIRIEGGTDLATRFAVDLEHAGAVSTEVFDVRGRRVRKLPEIAHPGGSRELQWDHRDDSGRRAKPGVYFIRARASSAGSATLKVALVD